MGPWFGTLVWDLGSRPGFVTLGYIDHLVYDNRVCDSFGPCGSVPSGSGLSSFGLTCPGPSALGLYGSEPVQDGKNQTYRI